MKKQILKSALIALAGVGLMSGSARAVSYWTITDDTTPNSRNEIQIDRMSSNGSFGIFYDFDGDNTIESTEIFQIFAGTDSENATKWLYIANDSGTYKVSLDGINYTTFDTNVFGYYFSKTTSAIEKYIFTDETKETSIGDGLLGAAWSIESTQVALFSWDITLKNSTANIAERMSVNVDDVRAVPEPTTMLLFGTGVVGLASVARRRRTI